MFETWQSQLYTVYDGVLKLWSLVSSFFLLHHPTHFAMGQYTHASNSSQFFFNCSRHLKHFYIESLKAIKENSETLNKGKFVYILVPHVGVISILSLPYTLCSAIKRHTILKCVWSNLITKWASVINQFNLCFICLIKCLFGVYIIYLFILHYFIF